MNRPISSLLGREMLLGRTLDRQSGQPPKAPPNPAPKDFRKIFAVVWRPSGSDPGGCSSRRPGQQFEPPDLRVFDPKVAGGELRRTRRLAGSSGSPPVAGTEGKAAWSTPLRRGIRACARSPGADTARRRPARNRPATVGSGAVGGPAWCPATSPAQPPWTSLRSARSAKARCDSPVSYARGCHARVAILAHASLRGVATARRGPRWSRARLRPRRRRGVALMTGLYAGCVFVTVGERERHVACAWHVRRATAPYCSKGSGYP
jgi:hypothetical protein